MLKIFAMADDETILIAVCFADRNIKNYSWSQLPIMSWLWWQQPEKI